MAKLYTFPTLYDEALQIDITKLKNWGFIKEGEYLSGSLSWSSNKKEVASVRILVNMFPDEPYLELSYNCNGEPIRYRIPIVSMPSNIGNGKIWYFLCPKTNKRCRKLYSTDGYFSHREAIKGAMYQSQTRSKEYRKIEKLFGGLFKEEKLYEETDKKHFKKFYKGKPTKRYAKILQELEEIYKIDMKAYERALYNV